MNAKKEFEFSFELEFEFELLACRCKALLNETESNLPTYSSTKVSFIVLFLHYFLSFIVFSQRLIFICAIPTEINQYFRFHPFI